jgi:hypothetical protein
LLPFPERLRSPVVGVEPQQIERIEIGGRSVMQKISEQSAALPIKADDLAVQDGGSATKRRC